MDGFILFESGRAGVISQIDLAVTSETKDEQKASIQTQIGVLFAQMMAILEAEFSI